MILLWPLIENFVLKFGCEKIGILNKIQVLHKALHGDYWKRIAFIFYQQASSLICNQTNHRTNICLPYTPANFVCGGFTVSMLSVRPSIRPSVRASVRNVLFS